MRVFSRASIICGVLISITAAPACSGSRDSGSSEGPDSDKSLDGTQWIVSALDGRPLIEGSNITLHFSAETLGGFAGCNWYGARFTVSGSTIRIENPESTARGCVTPAGVGEQEADYFRVLREVVSHRVDGDGLELMNDAGEVVIRSTPRPRSAMNPADLAGTRWMLRSVNDTVHASDSSLTLDLTAAELSGFAGCRRYTGTYGATGDELRVTSLTMSATECDSGQVALQREGQFTTDLSEATYYRLSGDSLVIVTAPGRRLVFIARRWDDLPSPAWRIVARRGGAVLLAAERTARRNEGRGAAGVEQERELPTLVFENGRFASGPTARAARRGIGPRDTIDVYTLELNGEPVIFGRAGAAPPLLESPTRPGVYVLEHDDRLWLLTDSSVVQLTADTAGGIARDTLRSRTREGGPLLYWATSPHWSPDGSSVAYVTNRTWMLSRPSGQEIWIVDATTRRERPLLSERGEVFAPAGWLGSELVYIGRQPGIFAIDLRTSRRRTIAIGTAEAFAPRGSRLLYTTMVDEQLRGHVVTERGVIVVPNPPAGQRLDHGGAFSPSGRRLVLGTSFARDSGITRALYVLDIDERRLASIATWNLREGDRHPVGMPTWLDDSTLLVDRYDRRTRTRSSASVRVPPPRR